MMRTLAGALLLVALVSPALGQSADFQQLLSGNQFPQNLKLKDLNGDWRRLNIGTTDAQRGGMGDMLGQLAQLGMMSDKNKGKDDPAAAMIGMSVLSGLFGGQSSEPVDYTKGQTVTVGSETFLLAYRHQKPALNFMQMAVEADKSGKDPDFSKLAAAGKLSPESPLSLSLINVKAIASLNNIRPFDMAEEIAESERDSSLMDIIAQQQAQESAAKQKPASSSTAGAARKPGSRAKAHP